MVDIVDQAKDASCSTSGSRPVLMSLSGDDIKEELCSASCPVPRSSVLVDRRIEELTKLARDYQKSGKTVASTQSTEVLVNQIMGQVQEGRDTITFAIPYNPSFIGPNKRRSEKDGLDIATRMSLDNIYAFANRVAAITGRKVSFILLYDSALSLGICEQDILRPADYLIGVEAIHRYNSGRNTDRVQIREWDTVSDSMLGIPQGPGFIESHELERAYTARLANLQRVFSEEGRTSLKTFVAGQIQTMSVAASQGEIEQTHQWISRTFGRDSREEAASIALSIELFKRIDARENAGKIIRLSPHVKGQEEHSKYGFAFFPEANIMMEPWVGNFVAKSGSSFVLDVHRKERSFEEAIRLAQVEIERQQRKRDRQQRAEKEEAREVLGSFTRSVASGSRSSTVVNTSSGSPSVVVDMSSSKPVSQSVERGSFEDRCGLNGKTPYFF